MHNGETCICFACRLERIEALLLKGVQLMSAITDALDALNAKVTALETVEASAITLLQGLKAALDAALALGDPVAIAAAVQDVANKLDADAAALAAAVAANTPGGPPPGGGPV